MNSKNVKNQNGGRKFLYSAKTTQAANIFIKLKCIYLFNINSLAWIGIYNIDPEPYEKFMKIFWTHR